MFFQKWLCLALIACVGPGIAAQEQANCQQRAIIVNALDRHGVPVKGLAKDDFKASLRHHSSNILSSSYTSGPRRIVILLDVSSSMTGGPGAKKWAIARSAVQGLVVSAPQKTNIQLITFADKIEETLDASVDRQAAISWLNAPSTGDPKMLKGHTALFAAIMAAIKKLKPTEPGDAICVITDGGENKSAVSGKQVQRELRASGVRLFTFLLRSWFPFPEEDYGATELGKMIRSSGGFEVRLSSADAPVKDPWFPADQLIPLVQAEMRILNAQISNFYVLNIALPESLRKPTRWELEVMDLQGRKIRGITLAYPHELNACISKPEQH